MADRIYCFSSTEEPGLVRIAQWRDDGSHAHAPCGPDESVDWSLDVENAPAAIAVLERSMRWYRKNRGHGIYRCSPKDAWSITSRHATGWYRSGALASYGVSDILLTVFLALALLSGILAMQVTAFDTAMTLSVTAILMAMLTLCLACARDRS